MLCITSDAWSWHCCMTQHVRLCKQTDRGLGRLPQQLDALWTQTTELDVPDKTTTRIPRLCSCCTTYCESGRRVSLNPRAPITPWPCSPTYTTLCPDMPLPMLLSLSAPWLQLSLPLLLVSLLTLLLLLLLLLADELELMRVWCWTQSRRPTATVCPSTVAVTPQPGSVVLSCA